MFFSMKLGWLVHKVSHTIDYRKFFDNIYNNYFPFIPNIIRDFAHNVCKMMDFHSKIHHDPKVNKIWYNQVMELVQNILINIVGLLYISNIF